jgi:glycine/D-amino acid oxidase-like deaminating enzyme
MAIPVTVVGAGAFGGWTALHLLRAGCKVTLVDAWGPGHSRASSGDETRVIRGAYGPNAIYTAMVARAIPMWKENERRWSVKLFEQNGALWMAGAANDSYEQAAAQNIRLAGMPIEMLSPAACRRRWPQVNWDGIAWAIYEKNAGFLYARRACQAVMEGFVAEGGVYRQEAVDPRAARDGHWVFACGPWLGQLFPEELGKLITPTRQEVFYFGTPAGDARFGEEQFPAWVDNSGSRYYGIPGNQWRGFKVALDIAGPVFDPTAGERRPSEEALAGARAYLARRFPALAGAPLSESRVCQYEMSPDGDLIIDRLPGRENVWVVGGGSGHGFKLGPAVGEIAAKQVLGEAAVVSTFGLARFAGRELTGVGERK